MATKTRKAPPAQTATVQGLVVAVDWNDDDDIPSQVAILTEADVEILVEDAPEARGLLELEDAEVEAKGELDQRDPDSPVLRVASFRVLSEPAGDEDELEDALDQELDDDYADEFDEYDRDPGDDPDD